MTATMLPNGSLLSRPAATPCGKFVAVVALGWVGPGRSRKKASVWADGDDDVSVATVLDALKKVRELG